MRPLRHSFAFRTAAPLAAALAMFCGPAAAQSDLERDGYYCVGPDYLAYQFSFSKGSNRHRLTVLSLARGVTNARAATVELPLFGVFGMRCNQTSVELRDAHTVYGVDISDRDKPTLIGHKPFDPQSAADFQQTNLGLWAFTGFQSNSAAALTIPLPSPTPGHQAALLVRVNEFSGLLGTTRRHHAEVVIVNERTGRVDSWPVFDGSTRVAGR